MSRIHHSRPSLKAGSAAAALAAMLAVSPACAQSTDRVSGARVAASHQHADHGRAAADTSGFEIVMAAPPAEASDIALRANAVSASARANQSDSYLTVDAAELGGQRGVTRLASGSGGITADSAALLVTTQRGVSSVASAQGTGEMLGLNTDTILGSSVSVADNRLDVLALGNDATATVSLNGLETDPAAGILGFQSNDGPSAVNATEMAAVRIGVGAASASDIAMTGNLVRARGYSNAFTSDLIIAGATASGAGQDGPSSLVPGAADGGPAVSAAYAALSHQQQDGAVTVSAGGSEDADPFHLVVFGALVQSSARHDGDALVAGGYGNQSGNAVSLRIGSVAASGALANLTSLQRAGDADIEAATVGGIRTNIFGAVSDSHASLSDNMSRAVAAANLAERNRLSVEASTIGTFGPPETRQAAAASAGSDNSASVTAAVSLQNVQDFGRSNIRAASTSALTLGVMGPVERSTLSAEANSVSVAATGNGAINSLGLTAALLRTSASLNNVQSGNGGVRADAGGSAAPLGVVLALPAVVRDSDVSVSDNELASAATGNSASNTMTVKGAGIASGGHGAVTGPLPQGYGAAADFALASSQTLGLSGSSEDAVGIDSIVAGRFGMQGNAGIHDSSYAVEGNGVSSTLIGNSVANRLSLEAASAGTADAPAPGAALSSAQYGQVTGRADAHQALVAPGSLNGSDVSLKDNSNRAYAGINEADNLLLADTAGAGALAGRSARVSIVSSPQVSGDAVLGNLQFAGGSIAANAATTISAGAGGTGGVASRFEIAGNTTAAEAVANRAANAVRIDALGAGGAAGGLGNMQMSTAGVAANASVDARYRASPAPAAPMLDRSSVAVADNATRALARGNAAENRLEVRGSAPFAEPATAELGRFEIAAQAGAPLLNAQTNFGSVTASSSGLTGTAFNGPDAGIQQASIRGDGNSVSAAASGNSAINTLGLDSGRPPSAAIVSSQVNYGAVSATATSGLTMPFTGLAGTSFGLTGNQLSAVAVGNQAANTITGLR